MQLPDAESPLVLHRRQFVIGPEPVRAREDWIAERLEGGRWLSRCPELRCGRVKDAGGGDWILLGLAIETSPDRGDPLTEIARTPEAAVPALCAGWTGRWLLIGSGAIFPDASGLLGCLYGRDTNGALWVSSSPSLIADALRKSGDTGICTQPVFYAYGISWYPPPRTRIPGVCRLLPSQALDLERAQVRARPLLPDLPVSKHEYDKSIEALRRSLATSLTSLAAVAEDPPRLGLTAGYDSRLMLAIAREQGIEIKTFTWISPRTSAADRILPPQLAKAAGFSHTLIPSGRRVPGRKHLIHRHALGHVSNGDAEPLLRGSRDALVGISFGGHGFALASGFWRLRELPENPGSSGEAAEAMLRLFGEPRDSWVARGIREWLEWVWEHPEDRVNWRERFFLEQRQAGWLSAKEQVYDLAPLERCPILNAGVNHALLLGFEAEWRLGSKLQVELIRRIAPELLQYAFNPPDQTFGPGFAIRAWARKPVKKLLRGATQASRQWHFLNPKSRPGDTPH